MTGFKSAGPHPAPVPRILFRSHQSCLWHLTLFFRDSFTDTCLPSHRARFRGPPAPDAARAAQRVVRLRRNGPAATPPGLGGASREPTGALLPAQLVSLGGSVSGGPCCPTSRLSAAMRGPMTRRPFRPLPAGTGPAETLGTFGRGPLGAGLGDTRDDAVLIGKHTACAKSPGKGLLGASGPCKVGDFLFRVRLETIIVLKKHVLMAWN